MFTCHPYATRLSISLLSSLQLESAVKIQSHWLTTLHLPPAHVETIEYDLPHKIDLHVVLRVPTKFCCFQVGKVLTLSKLFTDPRKISHLICTVYYVSSLQHVWLFLWKASHKNCLVSQGLVYSTQRIVLFSTLYRLFSILDRVFVELYWFPIVLTCSSELDSIYEASRIRRGVSFF